MAIGTVTRPGITAVWLLGRIPFAIVHDKEIEPPVVVVVQPRRGDRPRLARTLRSQAGPLGDVLKCPVVPVVEEEISVYSGHEQIGPAVIIEIGRGNAHAISGTLHTRAFRHIAK